MAFDYQNLGNVGSADGSTVGAVQTGSSNTAAPGIAGFFGATSPYQTYGIYSNAFKNPYLDQDQNRIGAAIGQLGSKMQAAQIGNIPQAQSYTMPGAQLGPFSQAQGYQAGVGDMNGESRAGMSGLAQQLQAQANGQGPTLAEQRMKESTDRGMAQSLAMAASARGANPGMAMRQAADSQANIQANAAQQEADLSQQEQMNARGQLAGVLQGMGQQDLAARGQDIGLAQFNAGQGQQNSQFNAGLGFQGAQQNAQLAQQAQQFNAQQQQQNSQFNAGQGFQGALQQAQLNQGAAGQNLAAQMQINDQTQRYMQMGLSLDEAQFQAQQDYAKTTYQGSIQQEAAAHGVALQAGQQQTQVTGAGLNALGGLLMAAGSAA